MYIIRFTPDEKLSDNFTLREATRSSRATELGIPNSPDSFEHIRNMINTAEHMQTVRALLDNKPVLVTSWYRNERVNRAVGGVSNSAHMRGLAVDFHCPRFGSAKEVCKALVNSKHLLGYDQLILEDFPSGAIVHIAWPAPGTQPRLQDLYTRDLKAYIPLTGEELSR